MWRIGWRCRRLGWLLLSSSDDFDNGRNLCSVRIQIGVVVTVLCRSLFGVINV